MKIVGDLGRSQQYDIYSNSTGKNKYKSATVDPVISYCLNPNCQKASSNYARTQFCQNCGDKLLLKERYRAIKLIDKKIKIWRCD